MKKSSLNLAEYSGVNMLASWIAYVFAAIMIAVFPLYFQDDYFDIMRSKVSFFQIATGGFLIISVILMIAQIAGRSLKERQLVPPERTVPMHVLALALLFLVVVFISTFMTDYRQEAIWGETGRRTTAVFWLLAVLAFLMLARYLKPGIGLIWLFFFSNIIVFLVAVANFWGFDPLGMHAELDESQIATFTTTIGNVNMSVSYDCLIYPIGLVLFYQSREWLSRVIYGIFVVVGCWALFCTTSEGWLFGIVGGFALLLWFGMSSLENFKYYCETAVLYLASLLAMQCLTLLAVNRGWSHGWSDLMLPKAVSQMQHVLPPFLIGGLLVIFAAGMVWAILAMKKSGEELQTEKADAILQKARRILFIVIIAVVAVVVIIIAVATASSSMAQGNAILQKLAITDDFGSGRGLIWRVTTSAWADVPFLEKLFGYGPNCFRYMIENSSMAEETLAYFDGAVLVDSHNEFLYILSTLGILGVIGYFGLVGSYLVRCFKGAKEYPIFVVGVVAVGASLLQGLVNSSQVFSTPLLFLFLGIMEAIFRRKRNPDLDDLAYEEPPKEKKKPAGKASKAKNQPHKAAGGGKNKGGAGRHNAGKSKGGAGKSDISHQKSGKGNDASKGSDSSKESKKNRSNQGKNKGKGKKKSGKKNGKKK